jgi:hypothetical protein
MKRAVSIAFSWGWVHKMVMSLWPDTDTIDHALDRQLIH